MHFLKAYFDSHIFKRVGERALKFSAIAFLGMLTYHLDKLVLSHFLDLRAMGIYCFAWTIVNGIQNLSAMLMSIFPPRFSHHIAKEDEKGLVETYHLGCQWMSILVFPAALFFIFFSRELLLYWCKDPVLVANSYWIASTLVLGSCFNNLYTLPSSFQLVNQWTRLTFFMHLSFLILFVPLLYVLTTHFGVKGSALSWTLLQFLYLVIYMHLMHRRLLKTEKKKWVIEDVALPFVGAFSIAIIGKLCFSSYLTGKLGLFLLFLNGCTIFLASLFMASAFREKIKARLTPLRNLLKPKIRPESDG